jgi:hypothetical protein
MRLSRNSHKISSATFFTHCKHHDCLSPIKLYAFYANKPRFGKRQRKKRMPTCCASRRKACQGFSLGRNQGFSVSTELALVPASTQYFLERAFFFHRSS